jgi:outer membrane lipopolysaccharide assembly protein LptE/RlpB
MKFGSLILLLAVLSSCWPSSVSFKDKGSMPEEWKTFSVKTLEVLAPNAPLSYGANLTEQLKDGIQNNTRLLLNTNFGKGEVNIDGKITNYNVTPIAIQGNDNATQNRLTISVQFSIEITKPKEELISVTSTRFSDFNANDNLAAVEAQLLEEINTQIIQDVINKLLSNW